MKLKEKGGREKACVLKLMRLWSDSVGCSLLVMNSVICDQSMDYNILYVDLFF